MTALELHDKATMLGLRLEPRGDKLAVIPANRCPPEFAKELRKHKPELMALLQSRAANLPDGCAGWLHTARQVIAGEFTGADRAMIESLTIGLRGIRHPLCRKALACLPSNREKPRL